MATKFSTLNVNAVEFVPSYGYSSVAASAAAAAAAAVTTAGTTPNVVPMEASSLPASGSATPATTPDSAGSGGSTNALNATAAVATLQAVPPGTTGETPADSPMQTSPVTTPLGAAPIENINTADKIAANNGKVLYRLPKNS